MNKANELLSLIESVDDFHDQTPQGHKFGTLGQKTMDHILLDGLSLKDIDSPEYKNTKTGFKSKEEATNYAKKQVKVE